MKIRRMDYSKYEYLFFSRYNKTPEAKKGKQLSRPLFSYWTKEGGNPKKGRGGHRMRPTGRNDIRC